jgi:prepilin-type processing-associated H-X9-DG protein
MKRLAWLIAAVVVGSLALAVIGMTAPILLIINIGFGWIYFVLRVFPEVRPAWPGIVLSLLCALAVLALGHWLARWLWRESMAGSSAAPWRMRWTTSGLMLVLLLFASGIAASGVVHQVGWLASSEDSMFTRRRPAHRIMCGSQMRQLGQLMQLYAQEYGDAFPDELDRLSLLENPRLVDDLSQCPVGEHEYVYHARGLSMPLDDRTPVLTEPLIHHVEGINILFGDGSVRFVPAGEVDGIFAAAPPAPPAPH